MALWGLTLMGLLFTFLLVLFLHRNVKKRAPLLFGSTYMNMNNPYFQVLNESIRDVIEANGDSLITRDPAQDQLRQNRQIEDMIQEGISVLFANPADRSQFGPALEACQRAGVAVFLVDTGADQEEGVISCIQSDNYEAGVLVAKDLMKKKPGGARILLLGNQATASMVDRRNGFVQTLSAEKQYVIAAEIEGINEIETANQAMDLFMQNWQDIDVVFGENDPSALGALAAIMKNRGSASGILIYGVDGSPDGKRMIKKGQMTGTVAQHPMEMGKQAAAMAYAYLKGKAVDREVWIPVELINGGNMNQVNLEQWQ